MSGPATSAGLAACARRRARSATPLRRGGPPAAHRARGLVAHLLLGAHLRVPVVHRHRHEHGAPWWKRRGVRSAGQRMRDVLRAGRLVAPLHQRVGHPRGVAVGEVGLQRHQRAVLLARGHHQRRVVRLRVEDRPHPVAQPRRGVQVDECRASRRLGVPVGHPDRHRLLQAEHVAEVLRELGQHRQLRGAGVAEHRGHAPLAQQLVRRLSDRLHVRNRTRARRPRHSEHGVAVLPGAWRRAQHLQVLVHGLLGAPLRSRACFHAVVVPPHRTPR